MFSHQSQQTRLWTSDLQATTMKVTAAGREGRLRRCCVSRRTPCTAAAGWCNLPHGILKTTPPLWPLFFLGLCWQTRTFLVCNSLPIFSIVINRSKVSNETKNFSSPIQLFKLEKSRIYALSQPSNSFITFFWYLYLINVSASGFNIVTI